jgi:PrcB C-terminal
MSTGRDDRAVPFRNLKQGWAGLEHKAGMFVARTDRSWESHWRRLHSARNSVPPIPDLDWATEIAVGYVLGSRPTGGYGARIEALRGADGWLDVCVLEIQPGPTCFTPQAFINPFHVVAIPAAAGALRLVERIEIRDCG